MIRIEGLTKSFGEKEVLKNISLEVNSGELIFLLGKSGTGKSVLLKNLVGLLTPNSGSIWVDDFEVTALNENQLVPVRKKCGMVFQYPALIDSMSVYENLTIGLKAQEGDTPVLEKEKATFVLNEVGLKENLFSRFPSELSHTIQKRIAVARALTLDPKYLLFDEPTTGMDPVVTCQLNTLMKSLQSKLGITLLVVSHDIKSALEIATRIILLDKGQIVFDGNVSEYKRSELPLVKQFLEEV